MRGWFVVASATVFGGIAACSAFGGDAPSSATATPDADATTVVTPLAEAGPAPTIDAGDAATDGAGPATGCGLDPGATLCFDFDTSSPTGPVSEGSATLSIQPENTSDDVLTVTVAPHVAGGSQGAFAYYPVKVPGTPSKVHWKFDVLLDNRTKDGVDFMQLDSGSCSLQPQLNVMGAGKDAVMALVESCGQDRTVTSLPVVENGAWWTFEFTVDFENSKGMMSATSGGATPTVTAPGDLMNATSSPDMQIEIGIGYAPGSAANAVFAIDNFELD